MAETSRSDDDVVRPILARAPSVLGHRSSAFRGTSFRHAQTALRAFGLPSSTAQDIRRFRIDGLRVWERRDSGWFVHTYRHVPAPLVRVLARTDGREVPIYGLAYYERVTTKQAGKKEIREDGSC